ncbi:hypothetical protein DENIS_1424 [Desulfonema ishimotonii]|uniref:Uncharacterized protein n=1 Tax=Desulfonema ishimotonii TaxID=45657 RepID=A0A401FU31_9BACT|nr:hypothetical protein [Desulfonema ishimotonii]GBC60471.1 hypothetical protein DENIS_1424 [Desulfonema ishimotonii]
MKMVSRIGILSLMICGMFSPTSYAGTLADDYSTVVQRRYDLEAQRKGYEKQLGTLAARKKSLTLLFFQCVSQKNKDFWETKLAESNASNDELSANRLELIDLRNHLDQTRKGLEEKRLEIEKKHTAKGPGTPYETEFREYMQALETEYFTLLETDLFEGYKTYLSKIEAHIGFLKESVGTCMKRKIK